MLAYQVSLSRLLAIALLLGSVHLVLSGLAGLPPQQPIQNVNDDPPAIPLPDGSALSPPSPPPHTFDTLAHLETAIQVMQEEYFALWQGMWTSAIDWTSAVMGTHISATLRTLLHANRTENDINTLYSQLIAFYFGQDVFALRQQAYDDMLWVVLGWLESVRFISERGVVNAGPDLQSWYGKQFVSAFAHRARLFWDFASYGWDTKLCRGGMVWNRDNPPYKNAITNELFIAASISMYLHFPGDDNDSTLTTTKAHPPDSKYLAAAVEGYRWLSQSNMTDAAGLYVDGYHISKWAEQSRNGTQVEKNCDDRDETVYTYNQGVLLTAQRGLYEATGSRSYLEDGHALIESVINATGYDLAADKPPRPPGFLDPTRPWPHLGKWRGLGRDGILEEFCDARAHCSQDAQTFKGIFFHHFTTFCARLPERLIARDLEASTTPDQCYVTEWHARQCQRYAKWVKGNALAAVRSQDDEGRFGMWWAAPRGAATLKVNNLDKMLPDQQLPAGAKDHRNSGNSRTPLRANPFAAMREDYRVGLWDETYDSAWIKQTHMLTKKGSDDLNDRGRGRTVETQSGGLAVLRALWELENGS